MTEVNERESMDFDVVIVGGGPSGLSAACRLMQLSTENEMDLSVVVVEKGSEIGAHILSGNVFETTALDELFPDWQSGGAPIKTAVSKDEIHYLTSKENAIRVPNLFVPKTMHNKGNYIISLGRLCQWLGEKAENLGVNLFPGFAASEVLYDKNNIVIGVATSDMGIGSDGKKKDVYQAGYELRGKYTVLAEGCRGNLGEEIIEHFNLRADADPQHYGIGLKEIWEIDPSLHEKGLVIHTTGWPLDNHTEGGGFLYHASNNQIFLGLIVALNYKNPNLSPFDEFQRWKHHPKIAKYLMKGKRISYGARAVNKGGLQSLPKLSFPGGALIGCDAGFLNGAKIKGSHTAIKSGTLVAESIFEALSKEVDKSLELTSYEEKYKSSWLFDELYQSRNFGPALNKFGTLLGGAFAFIDQNIMRGSFPFTWHNKIPDHETLSLKKNVSAIEYPKPDGKISFDRLSSVFLSSTNHEEDQPSHLKLKDPEVPIKYNLPNFGEPAQRYCPAGVYEILIEDDTPKFQINAQNCVHCKTCDIKDPKQNIIWSVPEGGGGPNYSGM
ncbi:MAG: electron transfer flavoprotein-ubiquinone oxidoreductase [Woeseiaceae bacterium]|nr:electron transfer flavoprotein-ubiquinone oxidoreductase [Woeseiaceae bacterium]